MIWRGCVTSTITNHKIESHNVESVITASIENGGLVLLVTSRVQLLNGWDKNLIDRRLPQVCLHNGVCFPFPDQAFSATLLCRRSHGDGPSCARCSQWKQCKFSSTRFLVKVQESAKPWISPCRIALWNEGPGHSVPNCCQRPIGSLTASDINCLIYMLSLRFDLTIQGKRISA